MTAKNRLGRLEAAQRRRPVEVPSYDFDALTEDDLRLILRLQEKTQQGKDLSALTADEAAAFAVICQKGKVAK